MVFVHCFALDLLSKEVLCICIIKNKTKKNLTKVLLSILCMTVNSPTEMYCLTKLNSFVEGPWRSI